MVRARSRPSALRIAHRRRRALRRLVGLAAVLAPAAWIVGTDLLKRPRQIAGFDLRHLGGYCASVVETVCFWTCLLYIASRRRGFFRTVVGALFVVFFTFASGVEAAFHAFWNIYLSIDGQIHSKTLFWSLFGTLPLGRFVVAANILLAAVLAISMLAFARRFARPRRIPRLLAPALLPIVLYAPMRIPVSYRSIQSTTPDMIYFNGITGLVKEHLGITHDSPDLRVQRRSPEHVPKLSPNPAKPRNVVLILQESLRADVSCIEYDPKCQLATRASNAAAPNRMPLLQMRANDSTTAISISNIWTGVRPTESRELLHSVPLLWEYAHAAGLDSAYWTSQNLMFGNARLYIEDIPVSHRAVATDLDSMADLDAGAYDRLLAERVIAEWGELKEPFFAVIHYSNIHWPYVYDDKDAPFQPADLNKSPDKNEEFKNFYKDVVYLSDLAVGRVIDFIRSTDAGKRTVLVYTSDHGESFREHWQLGHTSALYDEETHVPAWIDAPPGTLSESEEASIKGAREQFLWHLDLAPTFLDLMGVWDDPNLAPFRARMMGHPITRPARTLEPVPMTNCTWVWECAFRNWGMMQGPMKIEAREWDGEFHCFNVLEDPDELTNLGESACAPLPDLARTLFHVMPNVVPPGRPQVDWGKH